jgi:hypothetical protein
MKKALTSFRKKKRLILQITTMPAVAELLLIITVLLTGTTTTMPRVAVWATTGTVSNENVTDTDVATQCNEGLRGEEAQQSTTLEEEQPSAANQSESTTEEEEEDRSSASSSTEPPVLEPIVPLNGTETVEEEQPSAANQSESTILALSNSTNATAAADATNTTYAGLHGRIVFEKSSTGDDPYSTEIYVMNADGSGGQTRLTRVTDSSASASSPSWSPDGERIAFSSDRDAGDESDDNAIYKMNFTDGSNVTRLTETDSYYSEA